jgi:hypothetical protein
MRAALDCSQDGRIGTGMPQVQREGDLQLAQDINDAIDGVGVDYSTLTSLSALSLLFGGLDKVPPEAIEDLRTRVSEFTWHGDKYLDNPKTTFIPEV